MLRKHVRIFTALLFITIVAFYLRIYGARNNYPFWVDEFSSAQQARLVLKYSLSVFNNPHIYFENNNIVTHFIIAAFFKVFGQTEFAARLPIILIGSLVPLAGYLLAAYLFSPVASIAAALLIAFSYFEITWSRQARGYMLVQLLTLIALYLYFRLLRAKKSQFTVVLFASVCIVGLLTHTFFYILLLAFFVHLVLVQRHNIGLLLKSPLLLVGSALLIGVVYYTHFFAAVTGTLADGGIGLNNNFGYYHSFLWREYGLITFLGVGGLLIGLLQKRTEVSLLFIYLCLHLLFIGVVYNHHISKYLLPIFPLFFVGVGFIVHEVASQYSKTIADFKLCKKYRLTSQQISSLLTIVIAFFIITNGHKFVTRPKKYYSVNHDFREIANIDYHQIYGLIKSKIARQTGKTAVIDPWFPRVLWYMGQDFKDYYVYRWIDGGDPQKITRYRYNARGERIMDAKEEIKLIATYADLQKAMQKYPQGFILIDDVTLPQDVMQYAQKNFHKELYLDHYPLDDNPYSIWPATLYSWGFRK